MPSYQQIQRKLKGERHWINPFITPAKRLQTRTSLTPTSRILAERFQKMPEWQKAFFLLGILDEAERLIPPGVAELHEEAFGSPLFGDDLRAIIETLREVLTEVVEENQDYQLEANYTLNMGQDINTWIYRIDDWILGLIYSPQTFTQFWTDTYDDDPIGSVARRLNEPIEWLGIRFDNRYEALLELLEALMVTYAVKSVYDYLDPEIIIEANWDEPGWFYGPRGGIRAISTILELANTEVLTILAGTDEDIPFSYTGFMFDPAYTDFYIPYVWNRLAAKVPIARLANPQES